MQQKESDYVVQKNDSWAIKEALFKSLIFV